MQTHANRNQNPSRPPPHLHTPHLFLSELVWCLPLSGLQGVNSFVQYKFSHLPTKERQTIVELAKMFLNQINYWQLETPSQRRQRGPSEDAAGYKANYTRYPTPDGTRTPEPVHAGTGGKGSSVFF